MKKIEDVTDAELKEIAEVYFPENVLKDIDGDWVDINTVAREAFKAGFKVAVNLKLKNDLIIKKETKI